MNDPKEIALAIAVRFTAWKSHAEPLADAIAAALQAERDYFIAELNKLSIQVDTSDRESVDFEAELERVKAERDRLKSDLEAVKALKPFVEIKPDKVWENYGVIHTKVNVGPCHTALAVVEKVKQ